MNRIYLDYNASTPVEPRVVAAVQAALQASYGNPSSAHWAGSEARVILERARRQVADLLGCESSEIVFTSGGSESNNLALKGVAFARGAERTHIITTCVEHPAVLAPCAFLQARGARCTFLPVDATGRIDPEDLRRAITPDTALISIMHANNEVGTIQPIEACAAIAREHAIAFHTDAAQSVGKIATRVDQLGVDLLSIAGHKVYAPKGVGALYVRRGVKLEPLIHGAGHEQGRRAGTESALLCAALGEACALAADLEPNERIRALRERLWTALQDRFGTRIVLNGHPVHRLPNTLNVSFLGRLGSDVLARVPAIAASTGSACHSDRVEWSAVLKAMNVQPEVGAGAVRFSLGRGTTEKEIDAAVALLADAGDREMPAISARAHGAG
jgi:cysteine desulfurase